MRTRILFVLVGILVLLPGAAGAQQTQNRSVVEILPVGPPPAELPPRTYGLYDFHTTLEIGGQVANIHGNNEVYRSQLNYSDGFRLFGLNFEGKAKDPGAFFTRMYLRGAGWGGDPYNWAYYGLSKDRWFDFKASYVRSDYFFQYPGYTRDQHRNDQERRRQSYELTLFPQRPLRVRLGYFRNSSFTTSVSPMLTTYDFSRDEFAMFEPLRQTYDEVLIGVDWNIQKWSFFFDYSWRHFRNDRFLEVVTPPVPNVGNTPFFPPTFTSTTFLNFAERAYPARGHIPFVRLTITGRPHRTFDLSARLVYSRAKFDYTRAEINDGQTYNPSGAPPPSLITSFFSSAGETIRPNTLFDISGVWRPLKGLTISDTFRFNGFDISGGDLTNIFNICSVATSACVPGFSGANLVNLFDVDYFVNRFEIRYDFTNWLGVRAGHRHLHRDTTLLHNATTCAGAALPGCVGGTLDNELELEPATRVANVAMLGGDLRIHRTFTMYLDWERGGIDSVFNRIRRGHRTTARVRTRWQPTQGAAFSASYFLFDMRAPAPNVDSNQRNRGFTLDFSLTRWERFYWDIGYARNDVSSFTDIGRRNSAGDFVMVDGFTGVDCTFVGGVPLRSVAFNLPCRPSTYIDNNNYAYVDLGGRIIGNLHGEIGYRVYTATGTYPPSDPEVTCPLLYFGPCENYDLDPITGLPVRLEWGGLNFHQPNAGLRYVFSDNVTWKAGWRWYGYNLKFGSLTDYKAHIVTTSVLLSF